MDDIEAIKQLSARYNRTFDFGDVEGWVSCWTPEGTLRRSDAPGPVSGHQQFRDVMEGFPVKGVHVTSDFIIEVDGDRATASCTLMYLDRAKAFAIDFFGVYTDTLVRADDGWKYELRLLDVVAPV
jgi:hypothetical protein